MSKSTLGFRNPNLPYDVWTKSLIGFSRGQDCDRNGIVQLGSSPLSYWFDLVYEFWAGDRDMLLYTLHPITSEQRTSLIQDQELLRDVVIRPLSAADRQVRVCDRTRKLVDRQNPRIVREVGEMSALAVVPYGGDSPGWMYPTTMNMATVLDRIRAHFPAKQPIEVEALFELSEISSIVRHASLTPSQISRDPDGLTLRHNWSGLAGHRSACHSFLSGYECSRSGAMNSAGGPVIWYDLVADLRSPGERILFYTLHAMDWPVYRAALSRAKDAGIYDHFLTKCRFTAFDTDMPRHEVAASLAREIYSEVSPPLELLAVEYSIACSGWSVPFNDRVSRFCDWLRDYYPDAPQPPFVELLAMLSEAGADRGDP